MPGALPDGEPVPAAGTLPDSARAHLGERPFGLYVHVPFCTTRCGYCDFNTYTAAELGAGAAATSPGSYPDLVIAEIRFARRVLAGADVPVSTVFFGGGTPTLLPPSALGAILRAVDAEFGLAPGAEVTTEANPESVDEASLNELRAQGLTRVSFGMQSAVPAVLAELAAPDDDVLADRYLAADDVLTAAGYGWYEISNWAAARPARCAHNMLYWTGGDWWGIGPGAHSHVGGTRWWNVRHPAAYGAQIAAGNSPGQAREILSEAERQLERVMLLLRLAEGCPVGILGPAGRANAEPMVADGLADAGALASGRVVLTRRGRLLADAVTQKLTEP